MRKSSTQQSQADEDVRLFSAWLGFADREISPGRVVRIRLRWGRIALALAVLCLMAWMAKSLALYLFFRDVREFEDVAFMDMIAYPANRGSVRVQQGNYQIAKAKESLERNDYRRAFKILREGVARSPDNVEGRQLLAEIYSGWRPDLAIEIVVDGIENGIRDDEFIKMMVFLMLREKEDALLFEISERLLAEPLKDETRQTLEAGRLQSAIHRGRFDIARDVFRTSDTENTMDGLLLGTMLYNKAGRFDDATEVLEQAKSIVATKSSSPLFNQLIRIYKENGKYSQARETAIEHMINHPLDWKPRITLINVLSASGFIERRDKEIAAVLSEYRDDVSAMTSLAQLCADYGNTEAAEKLYDVALEKGYNLGLFSLTLAEAMVISGQHSSAIDLCNQLINENPSWMPQVESSFNAIRSLAYFGIGDDELGNLYLKNFMNSNRAIPNQLYQVALRYRKIGMNEQALALLEEAYRRDGKNENVLAELIEVEMSLGVFFSIEKHIKDLLGMRRPDYDKIETIYNGLLSDRFLFTENRDILLQGLENILSERNLVQEWDIWIKTSSSETG